MHLRLYFTLRLASAFGLPLAQGQARRLAAAILTDFPFPLYRAGKEPK